MSKGEFKAASQHITSAAPRASDEDDDGYALKSELAPSVKVEDEPQLPAVAESWDTFWPLARRVKVLAVMLTLNILLLPFSALLADGLLTVAVTLIVNSLAQAFVLGTFDRLVIKRSHIGKIVMSRTWFVLFYPLYSKRIRWREMESVSCRKSHENHFEDWIGFFLMLPFCAIPAILWYWHVIRPERLLVAFCKDHGFPGTVLFRSWDQKQAEDVARTVAEVTGRPWR